jgi:uncharacterized membrane protein YgcG
MAGGMGMASTSTAKQKKKKGAKNSSSSKKDKSTNTTPFDASASMIKSEKLYDELMAESTKAFMMASTNDDDNYCDDSMMDVTTEYIITARAKRTATASSTSSFVGAHDWVPVAQLCIIRSISTTHQDDRDHESIMEMTIRAAISYYCREINYSACLGAPSAFQSIPRNNVEYGVEPLDSFVKFVYEDVIEGKRKGGGGENGSSSSNTNSNNSSSGGGGSNGGKNGIGMTKAYAREILELEAGCTDMTMIKTAYKKQSFKYHPDRAVVVQNNDDDGGDTNNDREAFSSRFGLIQQAYDTLKSGVRNKVGGGVNGSNHNDGVSSSYQQSWYESLGGRERTEFLGPIELLSMEKASTLCCGMAFKSAVVGIDKDLTMAFVARNQAAARL